MPGHRKIDRYSVFFYSNEGELSDPPNVFVMTGEAEAEFLLSSDEEPTLVLKQSYGFSSEELEEIYNLLKPRSKKLRLDWVHAFC